MAGSNAQHVLLEPGTKSELQSTGEKIAQLSKQITQKWNNTSDAQQSMMKTEALVVALILEARLRLHTIASMPDSAKLDQYHTDALNCLVGTSGAAEPSGLMQDSQIVEQNQPYVY